MRIWWKTYGGLLVRLLSILGSYASLVGVLLTLQQPDKWTLWTTSLTIVSLILLGVVLVLEFSGQGQQKTYEKTDAPGIRAYMHHWISNSGRVAIWSRDLTWAASQQIKDLLLKKAHSGELVLCVPQSTEFTAELKQAGADVCVYGVGTYVPSSRFTIADFGKQGARVAVGRTQGDLHLIDEFDAAESPAFYLAQDLVALVRAHQGAGGEGA